MYWQPFWANAIPTRSQHLSETERQQSVNDFVCCILYNPRAILWHLSIIEVLAAFIDKIVFVDTVTPQNERQQSVNTASKERQQGINTVSNECQQSVNTFGCCIRYNPRALLQHMSIFNVLVVVLCKCDCDMVTAPD
jgi:D-mannonate dehydratase